MRKQWVALLSVLGLTGPVMRSESQVLKGSKAETKAATSHTVKKNPAVQNPKLDLKQQTLRQQNSAGVANKAPGAKAVGQNTGTCRYSEGCQTQNNQQLTKGNQQITKGNQQITKGNNQQITKGNQQITKGNQQITKGNQQITKGNTAVTKAVPPK